MKTIEIETETRPLAELLPVEDSEEAIYLTRAGQIQYVVVPFDEGDEESRAVRNNDALMAHVTECIERARKGPTKTLLQLRTELGLNAADSSAP